MHGSFVSGQGQIWDKTMTEADEALQDLLLYGQSFMLDSKHISLYDIRVTDMDIDFITYDQAIMGAASYLNETIHAPVQVSADILAAIFHKTNGEVYLDLKAERYEQKKVM